MFTRKRKHGGKYLGQGAYGCAFKPALPCKGRNKRTPNAITKLVGPNAFYDEYEPKTLLEGIDPEQKYFLYPLSACDIDEWKLEPENNIGKCTLPFVNVSHERRKLGNSKSIEFGYGGKDLDEIHLHPSEYIGAFNGFSKIFEAVTVLHRNNIVHLDIKPGNLVTKKLPDNTWDFHMIDFGFLTKTDNINSIKELPLSAAYYIWPFDIKFAVPKGKPSAPWQIAQKFWGDPEYDDYTPRVKKYVMTAESHLRNKIPIFIYNNISTNSSVNIFKSIHDTLPKKPTERLDLILKGADVYSLAIVLSQMTINLVEHDINKNSQFTLLTVKGLNASYYNNRETMTWHKTVYEEITLPIFRLVNNMMNPDVRTRIKIGEAHERYKAILPAINALFTEEQISKYLKGYVKFRSEPNPPWISNVPAPVASPLAAPVAEDYVGININNRMEINGNAFTNALSSAESSVGPLVAPSNRKLIVPAGPVRKPPPVVPPLVGDFSGRPPPMNPLNLKIAELIRQKGTRSLASMPLAEIMPAKTRKNRKNRKHRKE
jgi:serine/threonine protein kinase